MAGDKKEPTYGTGGLERCYKSHPPLPLGGGLKIYGGNGDTPIVKDADVYVSFLHCITESPQSYPWNSGEHFGFFIRDMGVPKNVVEFKKMVTWICQQVKLGQKVHMGCMGGHGRTGFVLAAVVKEFMGEEDAIQYVRDKYCKKAVESTEQVEFLHKHYGIKKRDGAKKPVIVSNEKSSGGQMGMPWYSPYDNKGKSKLASSSDTMVIKPVKDAAGSIWGDG